MLLTINPTSFMSTMDERTKLILSVLGGGMEPKVLQPGIIQIDHFSGNSLLGDGFDQYPAFKDHDFNCYGVCDNVENLLEVAPFLQTSPRKFVVTMTHLRKEDEPSYGGWRWHKWGPYIGTQKPQCEYLYDEPVIEEVWVYHVYELV